MIAALSRFLDRASDFLAARKGLLPIIGMLCVIANLVLQFFPGGWLTSSNLFLHIGVIIALLGILLAWAL